MNKNLIHFAPQYTIEFEPTHRQWIVTDTENYEGELGYYHDKVYAQNMADRLNERSVLIDLRTKVNVISDLLDSEADHLMKSSDPTALAHPRASSNLISDVGSSVDRIRILSNQLCDGNGLGGGGEQ
tara:strand:+ start:6177 stop:6557 length:381 start_codon:yes stop_codon:yes gene_type:complete